MTSCSTRPTQQDGEWVTRKASRGKEDSGRQTRTQLAEKDSIVRVAVYKTPITERASAVQQRACQLRMEEDPALKELPPHPGLSSEQITFFSPHILLTFFPESVPRRTAGAWPSLRPTGTLSGKAFYRKVELYDMSWVLRDGLREDSLVAAAPYGGPIAVMKESRCLSPSVRPQLEIYTASGVTMATFPWKSGARGCCWAGLDTSAWDRRWSSLTFWRLKSPLTVRDGRCHSDRLLPLHLGNQLDDLKLRRLPEVQSLPPGLQGAPSCWAVLNQDRQTKVLLANGPDLYLLDNTSCTAVVPPGVSPQDSVFCPHRRLLQL
ncbi:unnamed protein product [Lota lota]